MYYITNGVGSLSVGVDTVFLVSPSGSTFKDRGYMSGGDGQDVNDTRGILFTDPGLTLTISGNYGGYNIEYGADNVNTRNAAIRFNGTGTINFSAQTGGYDVKQNAFVDNDIKIYAESISSTATQLKGKQSGSRTVDIACFEATDLTISSDMSASLKSYSYLRSDDYKDASNNPVSTGSGNSAITTAYRVDNFKVANNYTGEIIADNDFGIIAVATPTVSGNNISTIGILAASEVTVVGNFDGTIESHIDGIYDDKGTPDDTSDDVVSSYNGMQGAADPTKTGVSASITGNTVSAAAIKSNTLKVTQDFDAQWISSTNALAFIAISNDKTAVTFTNNTLDVSGYSGNSFEVAGQLDGSIVSTANDLYIYLEGYATPNTNNRHHVVSGNNFTISGVNLSGDLTAKQNVGLDITVGAKDNVLKFNSAPTPSGDYLFTNKYYLYGINAKNINITGHVSSNSNIAVTSNMTTINQSGATDILFSFATYSYGIYTQNFTADNYAGNIKVTSGEYSCGIYVDSTLKSDSTGEPFNFNGSIDVSSNYVASGLMGFYDGYNLRVSGTILATGGTYSSEAITSGKWGIGNHGGTTYTYAVIDDYVELAASAVIKGDIQLDAGTNTFVVDSNAKVNGALRSNGGLTNVQFNLNGVSTGKTTITTDNSTNEDAFAVSTTKITINLNDAQAGQIYYLAKDVNVSSGAWGQREFTFTFQGNTQKVSYGDVLDFSKIGDRYNVMVQVLYDDAKGLYVNVIQQDSGYVLDQVTNLKAADNPPANEITLNWDKASGADTTYIVEYADNADFDKSIVKLVKSNTITLGNIEGTTHYRVRAVNEKGQSGAWSTSGSSNPGAVVPEAPTSPSSLLYINPDKPTDGINTAAVKFDWSDSKSNTGAIQYYMLEYVISSTALTPVEVENAFLSNPYQRETNASEFLLTGLPEQSVVYWRVCAVGSDGTPSAWTNGNEFKSWTADRTAPSLDSNFTIKAQTPSVTTDDGQTKQSLVFNWGGIHDYQSGISAYVIVCTGSNGYTKTYTIRETDPDHPTINSYTASDFINSNLSDSLRSGTYTYTFQAIDWVGNRTGLIQGNNTFTVNPTVPLHTTVTSVDNNTSATFTWQMPGDVTSYSFEYMLGDTADFSKVTPINFTVNDPRFGSSPYPTYTVSNLAETSGNTSYFWRIQANYADGTSSNWINGNSFYFDNTAPDAVSNAYAVVDIKYKTSTSTNNWGSTTTSKVKTSVNAYLYWGATTDSRSSVTYTVEVADNEFFNNSKTFGNLTTNSLTFGDGTNGTVAAGYLSGMKNVYWRVYASDQNGNTSAPANGSFYYVINPYVSDVTVAQYFKWGDVDTIAPTKVTIASQVYSGTSQYFSWSTSTSMEGVAGYYVTLTDKQGHVMLQTNTSLTHITLDANSGVADGTYKMSVQAVGSSGKTSAATTKSVFIDFNGPSAVNQEVKVFNADVNLTWSKPYDLFGVAGYQIRYYLKNNPNTSVVTYSTSNKMTLTGLANGLYTCEIRGIDNNGNYGVWNSKDFTVDTVKTAGKTYGAAKDMAWGETSNQSFGGSWPANYFKYTAAQDGLFTFDIDNMAYGNGKLSVYSVVGVGANATLKLIKTYSVTQGKDYSFLFNLKAGDYCVMLGSASNYNYGSYTIDSTNNYNISAWTYDTQDTGGSNYITGGVTDGVLGYGTPSSTYSFSLLANGTTDFALSNVTGGTVTMTIYQTVNGVDKKLKTLSVSAKNAGGALKGLNLYAGDYKVVLSNSQASQNVTVEYDLNINGSYFPADTESLTMVDQGNGTVKGTVTDGFVGFGDPSDSFTFTASSQAEYNFALSDLSAGATMTIYQTVGGKQVKLTTVNAGATNAGYFDTLLNSGDYTIVINNPNPSKANTTFDLTVQSENNLINYTQPGNGNANGWLNPTNSADYYDFTMYSSGKVTLTLDNVTASTKLSIIDSNNKVVGTITTGSLVSKDFNLAAGDYWLKVESTKSTAYDFNVLVA